MGRSYAGAFKKLDEHKPVIYCGDLNVAKEEIDLKILQQIAKMLVLLMRKEIR